MRGWLAASLAGDFAPLVGSGGPGREHEFVPERMAWERLLGDSGWIGLGWPEADGGRGLPWSHEVIFYEEYARAGAPARVGHIGEQLLGPTLLMFGTAEQRQVPAGDLAGPGAVVPGLLRTRRRIRPGRGEHRRRPGRQPMGDHRAEGMDVACPVGRLVLRAGPHRARPRRGHGLSYLLVPMRQPGVEVRPIGQLTGTSEFNEVFFDDARAAAADIVGEPGDGWRVAMGTLAVERGVSTLGQQLGFQREFEAVLATARATGAIDDPDIGARIVEAWAGLEVMRYTALATLGRPAGAVPGTEANVNKLIWAQWHQRLGELAVDVSGAAATLAGPGYGLDNAQRLFLYTRADTIYGGSNEIQRNVIAERGLGLPREPR